MSDIKLKPCPFCGCSMDIYVGTYPNGDERVEPRGMHDVDCLLESVGWYTYPEDGWTAETIMYAWNRRANDAE